MYIREGPKILYWRNMLKKKKKKKNRVSRSDLCLSKLKHSLCYHLKNVPTSKSQFELHKKLSLCHYFEVLYFHQYESFQFVRKTAFNPMLYTSFLFLFHANDLYIIFFPCKKKKSRVGPNFRVGWFANVRFIIIFFFFV